MTSSPLPPLKNSILERIESERICPRSRWFFRSVECVVWTAWLLSVMVGAVAVAVTLYVVRLRQYDLYEVSYSTFRYLMAEALPCLWIGTLVGMVALAVYNLRHTARGYRYPLWVVVGSSVLGSATLGFGFHLLNIGFMVDRSFGEFMPTYPSQMRLEERQWQQPETGKLIGHLYAPAEASSTIVQFIDMYETVWAVETRDLSEADRHLLVTDGKVRLMGMVPSSTPAIFHACGAFPWMMDAPPEMLKLERVREDYRERIQQYATERYGAVMGSTSEYRDGKVTPGPCHAMPVLTHPKFMMP